MSNFEFDNFFRRKLESEDFLFSDTAWSGAEELLDAQKAAKAKGSITWYGASFLAAMATIGLVLLNFGKAPHTISNDRGQNGVQVAQGVPFLEEAALPGAYLNQYTAPESVMNVVQKSAPVTSSEAALVAAARQEIAPTTEAIEPKSEVSDVSALTATAKSVAAGIAQPPQTKATAALVSGIEPRKFQGWPSSRNWEVVLGHSIETIEEEYGNAETAMPTGIESEVALTQETSNAVAEEAIVVLDEPRNTEPLANIPFIGFSQKGSTRSADAAMTDLFSDKDEHKLNRVNRGSFGVIAGVGLSQGFIRNQSAAGNGILDESSEVIKSAEAAEEEDLLTRAEYMVGFQYQHRLNGRISVHLNALYQTSKGLNSQLTVSNETYGLGADVNNYRVTPQSLHYLSLPIYFGYHHDRHEFQLGGQFSYLLNVKSDVHRSYENSFGVVEQEKGTEWGYTQGFKTYDASILVGYDYMLTEQFLVGARANYGIYDVTDNNQFDGQSIDNNVQFRITANYKIFGR